MPAIATQTEVFPSTDSQREVWKVTAEVAKGEALVDASGKPAIAFTASGGHVKTETLAGLTISGIPDGGASLSALEVSVAVDGSHCFPVTGVTNATPNGTQVYAVVASGLITSLTLTVGSNTKFGRVNQPKGNLPTADKTVVKIGA